MEARNFRNFACGEIAQNGAASPAEAGAQRRWHRKRSVRTMATAHNWAPAFAGEAV